MSSLILVRGPAPAREEFAKTTTSETEQLTLIKDPDAHMSLAMNSNLTDAAWFALWGKKPAYDLAWEMTLHPLSPARVAHILSTDSRRRVIRNVLRWNEVTYEQGVTLLASGLINDELAGSWLVSRLVPAELVSRVASLFPAPMRSAEALRSRHLFDQGEMLLRLAAPGIPEVIANRAAALISHPNAGPAVVEAAFETYNASRLKWDWGKKYPKPIFTPQELSRPVNFPYAITRPWEECDTPQELALLWQYGEGVPHALRARLYEHYLSFGDAAPTPVSIAAAESLAGYELRHAKTLE